MPGLLRTRTPLHRRLAVCRPTARDPGTGLPGVSLCTGVSGTFNDRHRPRSPPIPGFPRSAAQGDRVMVQARVVDRVMVRARVVDRAAEPVCEGQGAWRISCGRIPAEVRGTSAMSVPSTIDHRATGYSLAHAYWLAKASDLAYKDEATIEEQARAWGFDRVRHHQTRFSPPFPLQDTQAYAAASDHMIVTAFRGTEPVQIKDWLSDATTPHHTAPPRARRHRIRPPRLRRRTGIDLPRRRGHPRGVPHQRPDRLVHRPQPRRRLGHARRRPQVPGGAAPGRGRRAHLRSAPHLRPTPGRRLRQGLQEPHVPLRQQQRHRAPDAPSSLSTPTSAHCATSTPAAGCGRACRCSAHSPTGPEAWPPIPWHRPATGCATTSSTPMSPLWRRPWREGPARRPPVPTPSRAQRRPVAEPVAP